MFRYISTLSLFALVMWFSWVSTGAAISPVGNPTMSPAPVVTLSIPGEVMIGEDFQFEVKFKNNTAVGYAPYVELYLPAWGADGNSNGIKCDGITFVSAETQFTFPPTLTLPVVHNSSGVGGAPPCPLPYGPTHPFNGATFSSSAPSGQYQLIVLELPFGSFDPTQPEVVVNVTANLSDFADEGTPLTIYARGGFRYGGDELDNHPGDPLVESTVVSGVTKPVVLKINKRYAGPEDEAVSGPNFINYYPLNYKITADVANGQTLTNLTITDDLPGDLQFAGNVQVKIQGSNANVVTACPTFPGPLDVVVTAPSLTTPNGILSVKLCSAITGTTTPSDVEVTFDFFIPQLNANSQAIIKKDCSNAPVLMKNDIKAGGDWDPLDPRDPLPTSSAGTTVPIKSDLTGADHSLSAKCLAIQKSVKIFQEFPSGATGPTPGDILEYQLQFQVSDYFTIGRLVVTDFLANGLDFINVPPPQLRVTDLFGTTGLPTTLPSGTVTTVPSALAAQYCPIPLQTPPTGSLVRFNVSQAMNLLPPIIPRHDAGLLTGGHAAGAPVNVPATGTIVFYARIRDTFKPPVLAPHEFVDKHDPINNCVQIQGRVFGNVPRPTPLNAPLNIPTMAIGSSGDRSGAQLIIVPDTLKKTIHTVTRAGATVCGPSSTPCSNYPNTPQEVRPGDQVTFRIEKEIPSSDAENVLIEDWLPRPAFDITDTDGDSTPGPAWTPFNHSICGIPASGSACLGPTDTLHNLIPSTVPFFFFNPPTNSLRFIYGTFNDPANVKRKIDLLFTLTVTNKPFADGLFHTNEVRECEENSFGGSFCQVSIAQVKIREPRLGIKKGVVATDNPRAEFKPALSPAGIWQSFGASCPRFNLTTPNAPLTSASLNGLVNSDLYYADANDSVTFAIAIENTGGAPAYNVEFIDKIPLDELDVPACFGADFSGLCITNGNGIPIPFTTGPGGHGRIKIKLGAPLDPLNSTTANTGSNIAIITFNAKLLDKDKLKAGCCDNTATLTNYTSTPVTSLQPQPPNFVDSNLGGPFEDKATIYTVARAFSKCIVKTSEVHTVPQTAPPGSVPVAIGEIVRYRVAAAVPEGISVNFQITDQLPAGMLYLGQPRIGFVSTSGSSSSLTSTTISGPGLNFPGADKSVRCSPSVNPVLTFPLATGVSVASGSGGDVTFSLGDVTNNDSDIDQEFVVIEFNALVENISGNTNGTTFSNGFGFNDSCPVPPNNISVNANVVEPNLVLTKTASPSTLMSGSLVNFTVTVTNNGTADAFDVVVTDPLPAGLIFVSGSLQTNSSCASPVVSGGNVTIPRIPVGCSVTITYQARVRAKCPLEIKNTATADYTSLPGSNGTTGPPNNTTGSVTPGPSGAPNGEHIYHASETAIISVVCNPRLGSLTVNKVITTAPPPPLLTPPANVQFPVTVSCAPSGITQTFNLSAAQPTQIVSNIPIGNTCTVIEGPLPPPFSNPVCAALGWTPVYSPSASVLITGGLQTVTITNTFSCFRCAQPPTGMVAWWPMDVVNNKVNDIAPGSFNNVGSAQSFQPVTGYVMGVGAGALYFNSTPPPVVIVPPHAELDFVSGDFSVDAWVRLVSGSPGRIHGIADKFNPTSGIGYAFYARNQRLELNINGNTFVSSGPLMQFANPLANTGPWYHVAVTVRRNPAQIVFYINGSQAGVHSPAVIGNFVNTVPLWIGGSRVSSAWQELAIDELELFNRPLTQGELQTIFNAGAGGKCRTGLP